MQVTDLFTLKELNTAVKEGLVLPTQLEGTSIVNFNYTNKAAMDQNWFPCVAFCRALLVDLSTGEIVGRAYDKFFNYSEPSASLYSDKYTGPVEVTDKVDGMLGVVFWNSYSNKWTVSTRGNPNSIVSEIAEKILYTQENIENLDKNYSYVVEIICPESFIQIDYGNVRELVLHGIVRLEDGEQIPVSRGNLHGWVGPVVDILPFTSLSEAIEYDIPNGKEGIVIFFIDTGTRLKIKGEDYLQKNRLLRGVKVKKTMKEVYDSGGNPLKYINSLDDDPVLRSKVINLLGGKIEEWESMCEEANNILSELQGATDAKYVVSMLKEKCPKNWSVFMSVWRKPADLEKIVWKGVTRG